MKTTIITLAMLFTFNLSYAINLNKTGITFSDESYIDDIPFDTKEVATEKKLAEFSFEEETYINDIFFDTEFISLESESSTAQVVDFEAEKYIDDIPFDTEKIAATYRSIAAFSIEYRMEEENYIDDIPFNTAVVANDSLVTLSF